MESEPFACISDEQNNQSMIQMATIGIATDNPSDDVEAIADYVCDSVENDGLLDIFKHMN